MHRTPLAALLAVAAAILLPTTADAVTLHVHRHHTIYKTDPDGSRHPVGAIRWTEIVRQAPADRDQDGVKDTADDCPDDPGSLANGCDPAPVVATPALQTTPYQPPTYSSGGCPSYMSDEASSPTDVNPTSGASGCWQVIPSTRRLMGTACTDVNSTACLSAICAAQGNEAWASSGATPCG